MTTKPAFGPRWLITGRLRLTSELHLGTGERRPDDALRGPRMTEDETPDIALVAGSDTGRPYIPGTSLKGALRAWINRHLAQLAPDGLITDDWQKDVFGHVTTRSDRPGEEDDGLGGRVIIGDAEVSATQTIQPAREARIAIDPRTRTVDGRRLFHQQTLPPGTVFNIRVVIETPPAADGRQLVPSAEIAQALLTAFAGFDTGPEETRIRLGADKGMGKGAAVFELGEVRCYDAEIVKLWLGSGGKDRWDDARAVAKRARRKADALLQEHKMQWKNARPAGPMPSWPWIFAVTIDLHFTSRLLMSSPDPSARRAHAEKRRQVEDGGIEPLVLEYRRTSTGDPALPATSVKGVLRARVQRILNTIFTTTGQAMADSLTGTLFGSVGHRGRVRIGTPQIAQRSFSRVEQEYIALDRFSGGGADGRKFKVAGIENGHWSVPVTLNLEGLEEDQRIFCFACMCLLFKDLADGDVTFGHGAARGYGRSKATIRDLRIGEALDSDVWSTLRGIGPETNLMTSEVFILTARQALRKLHAAKASVTDISAGDAS